MPSSETAEASPAFDDAGQKPGMEIWRIEAMEPVRTNEKEYGQFYSGDCYLLLNTKTSPGSNKFEYDLHFWIGKECSQDESTTAAARTVELDELVLGSAAVQYRETQEHESKLFLSYFKNGVKYLKGGVDSALNKVDPNAFEKRLFQVKGKKSIRVAQVECKCSSLNQGDTFVLDCGKTIYVWVGPKSEKKEQIGGVETAQRIRDEERGGQAVINVIEEDWETNEQFFKALGSKDKVIRAATDADDDDVVRNIDQAVILYQIVDVNKQGNKAVKQVGESPLKKSMLNSQYCYVLDAGVAGVYAWMGKQSSKEVKDKVWNSVNGFVKNRGYPAWVAVTRVVDGGETSMFKQYFVEWDPVEANTPSADSNVSKMDYTGAEGINVNDMHKQAKKAEEWMPDDGNGKLQVWHIENLEPVPVPDKAFGVFFGGDCYVILYTYKEKDKEKHIIYYWQGRKSTTDDQTASAAHVVQLDNKLGGAAVQIRVVDFKEPLHFLKIFKGKLIVFSSGHVAGYRNMHDHSEYDPKKIYMFQIRSDENGNTRANEVIGRAASLNSNDVFIVDHNKTTFVWLGKSCSQQEQDMAKHMGKFMKPDHASAIIVKEGQETEKFWSAVGGKEPYYTGQKKQPAGVQMPPRLFECSNVSGRFAVEEIVNFFQDDLDTTDVMLLDTYDEIFVWLGEECLEFEKKEASKVANNYLLSDPTGRNPDNTLVIVVRQGFEPPQFTGCFLAWDPNRWSEGKTFKEMVDTVGKENAGICLLEDEVEKYHQFYPLDVLQRKTPPEGVDVTKKEMYLKDDEFKVVFKMTKEEYMKLPEWKKLNLRKEKYLF